MQDTHITGEYTGTHAQHKHHMHANKLSNKCKSCRTHLLWLFQVLGTDLQQPHSQVGEVVELLPGVGGKGKVVPAVEAIVRDTLNSRYLRAILARVRISVHASYTSFHYFIITTAHG